MHCTDGCAIRTWFSRLTARSFGDFILSSLFNLLSVLSRDYAFKMICIRDFECCSRLEIDCLAWHLSILNIRIYIYTYTLNRRIYMKELLFRSGCTRTGTDQNALSIIRYTEITISIEREEQNEQYMYIRESHLNWNPAALNRNSFLSTFD